MRVRQQAAVAGAIISALVLGMLVGCDSQPGQQGVGGGQAVVRWVDLGDGTQVRCVIWWDNYKGGPSCDWDRLEQKAP